MPHWPLLFDHRLHDETKISSQVAHQKTVNLALQGVGSHGAFTWGVLDRLLEDERLSFDGISATSAGAVNAVVLAYGLAAGGREQAKSALQNYWRRLSEMTSTGIFQPTVLDQMSGNFGLDLSPGFMFVDALSHFFSPYELNPLKYNPFKDLLDEVVDFELLRRQKLIKLFLCATNVRSGKVKIFGSEELRSDHVVASSCQPIMMHAVEIDGEYYWDGGFMGNPAIFPVIYACEARDIVLVRSHADRAAGNADDLHRHLQPHAGGRLQLIADARDACRRFRDRPDRQRQDEPTANECSFMQSTART